MSKIKLLPLIEAKKIAAGEVIERPANIVKELVENSIDAGSKSIFIYIVDGGKKLIRIIDDGSGMSPEDARLSFEHHATSKISTVEDLYNLNTFGFRGEALSSIASISKVTMTTKEESALSATKLYLEDGQIKAENEVAANRGTEIYVEDIFYNVPARQKFLKKDDTEYRQIVQLFQAYVFSYKDIHFKLFNDDNLIYNCPPVDDIKNRISQIWDSSISKHLIEIKSNGKNPEFAISGYLTDHQSTQYNRNKIFLFVNKRCIKNNEIMKSVLRGYANVLPQGRFPAGILFIDVPPADVDVNIHPRKDEVKLLHSFKVESAIQQAITAKLEQNLSDNVNRTIKINAAQVLPLEKSLSLYSLDKNNISNKLQNIDYSFKPAVTSDNFKETFSFLPHSMQSTETATFSPQEMAHIFGVDQFESNNFEVLGAQQKVNFQVNTQTEHNVIGQFKKTYLLLEAEDGLIMIDQHAAHESILFDLFLNKFEAVATVKLIFPQVINLSQSDLQLLYEHLDLIKKYGLEIDILGENELVISATPVHIKDESLQEFILQIIGWLQEFKNLEKSDFDNLFSRKLCAQMACKAAVKAGDELSHEQIIQLLNDLHKIDNRFSCPHGRPTMWNIGLYEIEKKFKRKN